MISTLITEADIKAIKSIVTPALSKEDELTRRLQRKLSYRHFRLIEALEDFADDAGSFARERVIDQIKALPDWLTRTIALARFQKRIPEAAERALAAFHKEVMLCLGLTDSQASRLWSEALARNLKQAEKELF